MTKTVSLEMARKLKEAGWKQRKSTTMNWLFFDDRWSLTFTDMSRRKNDCFPILSAPDIAELLEAFDEHYNHLGLKIEMNGSVYDVSCHPFSEDFEKSHISLVEALAALWIQLNMK